MLSDRSYDGQGAGSSATEGTTTVEVSVESPAWINTPADRENEDLEVSNTTSIPQTMLVVPSEMSIPVAPLLSFDSDPAPPQIFNTLGFISPQQIFAPPASVTSVRNGTVTIPAVVPKSPLDALSSPLKSSQTIAPRQTAAYLVAPSPILDPSQTTIDHQVVASPMIPTSSSPIDSCSVLESPQSTIPSRTIDPPAVNGPPYTQILSTTLGPSRGSDLPQTTHESQSVALRHPSDPFNGVASNDSGAVVASQNGYKLPHQTRTATTARSRHGSIEGAPEITLTLNGSDYELVIPSAQPVVSITPSITPSDAAPSSQVSLEEFLTPPMETEADFSGVPPMGGFVDRSLEQSHKEPSTTPASGCFYFAPRIIPDYSIDRSDLPSWFIERGRLDYVLSVEAGNTWEKLIAAWLRQERRLGFGAQVCGTSVAFV